jgi:phage head maturation protease
MNIFIDNIKAKLTIDNNTIKGYAVVFDSVDLQGEKFTKDTFLGVENDTKTILMYNHGFDKDLKRVPIGITTKYEFDDYGLKFEAELKALNPKLWKQQQIENNEEYLDAIKDLIKSGKLGISTGAVGHSVVKSGAIIQQWLIGEISVTPTPAEPKTFVEVKAGRVISQKNLDRISTAINELNSILVDMQKEPETAKDMIFEKEKETETKNIVQNIDIDKIVLEIKNLLINRSV